MPTVLCPECGREFHLKPCRIKSGVIPACSMDCRDAGRRIEVACAVCDKKWPVKRSRAAQNESITCSPACKSIQFSRLRIGYWGSAGHRHATCANCGVEFTRSPSQIAKYAVSYCSRECHRLWTIGRPNEARRTGEWHECAWCGKAVWRTPGTLQEGGAYCSHSCSGSHMRGAMEPPPPRAGPDHHYWRGGRGGYGEGFTGSVKRAVRERDDHACQICGLRPEDDPGKLLVHHIDFKKDDHSPDNLITLCKSCHMLVHHRKVICPAVKSIA